NPGWKPKALVPTNPSRPIRPLRGGRRTAAWSSSSLSNSEVRQEMIGTKRTPRNLVIALVGAMACLLVPAVARAHNSPAVEKLIQMNKKALDDYETLEWDSAKRTLLQALVFGKKSNLETHPMMARTYVHLGAVYIVGFNDKQKGLQSFQRALEIDPTIHISKAMSTPELEDIFAQASGGAGGGKGGRGRPRGGGAARRGARRGPCRTP